MTLDQEAKLHILVGDIRRRAKVKLRDASLEVDEAPVTASRALRHAAICEANIANELERIIAPEADAPADPALE